MAEITLTKENFEKEVLNEKGTVLVDFFATWCGPCKMLSPVIHQVAEENAGVVKVGKVDVDDQMELANQYGIVSIPTLLLFENGEVTKKSIGNVNEEELVKFANL